MKAVVLFSGGKDSTASLHLSYFTGADIRGVCIAKPKEDSMVFHYPYTELAVEIAKLMGFDYFYDTVNDNVESIARFIDKCSDVFKASDIIAGVIRSDYQRVKLSIAVRKIGKKLVMPLWGFDPEEYLWAIHKMGIRFIIVKSMAYGLPRSLIGKIMDERDINYLLLASRKYKFNPAFEGGEAETLVVKAPLMKGKIHVEGEVRTLHDEILNYFITLFRVEL